MEQNTITVDAVEYSKLVEMKRKSLLSARKATVKNLLFVEKAKEAGITVSKSEVEARIAEDDAKKAAEPATESVMA